MSPNEWLFVHLHRCTGGKQRTADEYLLGDQSMPACPVAFSLMASFMSAITLLGVCQVDILLIIAYLMDFIKINIAFLGELHIRHPVCDD